MLSKNHQKLIISLKQKKFRQQHRLFAAEGSKIVLEALNNNFQPHLLFYTKEWIEDNMEYSVIGTEISYIEMKKISNLKNPPGVLAVFNFLETKEKDSSIILALDSVKDPGNLGTMIRTAHAFRCEKIICSKDTVDCYNPKVVQASMGSIFKIDIQYLNIVDFIYNQNKKSEYHIYSFDLKGDNIYDSKIKFPAILILGNESNGVGEYLDNSIDNKLKIPISDEIDSLNVSISQAIALFEFNRLKH